MTEAEKKFLEENFKAGEYSVVTIMVRHDEFPRFMEAMKASNLNLAILPGVKPDVDFMTDRKGNTQ